MRRIGWLYLFVCFVFLGWSDAEALNLTSVKIQGNKRIEKAAILDKLHLKSGQSYSRKKVTEDVKRLFDTGFFYNIKVDLMGSTLTYLVEEKPVISSVEYEGNTELDDDDLQGVSLLKANELLDVKKVNRAISDIKKKYEEKGYFLAKVDYKTKPSKNGSQKLILEIKEGDKVKIRKVDIVGNTAISDSKLKSIMVTKETGIFGTGGTFQKEALLRDREVLAFVYQNEGYAQVQVSDADVALTPDKRGLKISYYITEGKKFKMDQIGFSGDVDFSEEELKKLISIDENEHFSREVLISDLSKLKAKYGDEGYAYANVVPKTNMDVDAEKLSVDFKISKGDKVRIGEINVKGNSNTRDKVVRRELKILEGELYHETNKRKSQANVQRLGFFDGVDFQEKVSSDGADIMDLDIVVKERSTGQLNIGAGYGGYNGFSLQGSVQQANFLGKGINFGLNINYSERREQLFNLNITDPYFRDTDWSLGFDAFRSLRSVLDFRDTRTGAALSFGRKFSDYFFTSLRYKFEKTEVELDDDALRDVFTPEKAEEASGYSSGVTLSAVYDRRNDRRFPTKGYYGRLALEQTGLGGDITFSRLTANARYYKPLVGSLVLRNNLNYGWVNASGEVPINELFRLGGPNTVRGYDFFSIAQRRFSSDALNAAISTGNAADRNALANIPYGGVQQLYYNLELEWGLVKEAGIKGVVFFDIGTANDSIELGELKSSWGLGFRWNSPMGPLRFEWAFAIDPDKRLKEKESDFQFSIMQSF